MMNSKGRRLPIGFGFVLGITLALVAPIALRGGHDAAKGSAAGPAIDPGQPLGPLGVETTLSGALTSTPVPLYRPQTAIASDSSISGLWIRDAFIPEAFFRYASGIEVSVRLADFSNGFVSFHGSEIAQGYPGELTKIGGIDAFVTPGGSEGSLASVDMVISGMLVEIVGRGDFSADQVTAVADSIVAGSGAVAKQFAVRSQ